MAHDLFVNQETGKASMFYVYSDGVPWHKLGTRLDNPATSKEAIEAAGLDFEVVLKPVHTYVDFDEKLIPNKYATVRSDTNDVLGVVGARYQPIQNREAFTFFDSLVGEGEAIFHTAGVLSKGERIWVLAKLPDYIKIGKKDIVDKYLLLTNSHDGSSVVRAKLTPIRVVCNNTLSVALTGTQQEVRIRHTVSAVDKLEEGHKLLKLSNSLYEQLDSIFNKMALRKISDKQLMDYVKTLVPDNPESKYHTRTENIRNSILDLHESGQGADLSRGTAWGAYNALVEHVDYFQGSKQPDKHLKSIWFGSGERLKLQAFKLAQKMMNN